MSNITVKLTYLHSVRITNYFDGIKQIGQSHFHRMLALRHVFVSMCLFVRFRWSLFERLTELCAISVCEHFLCTIKTIFTKYDWCRLQKIHATFSTVFSTNLIGRIIIQSEFKMHFSALQRQLPWQHIFAPKIVPDLIRRNCHLSIYFNKITLNRSYFKFKYCQTTVLHGINHHKYRLYEF